MAESVESLKAENSLLRNQIKLLKSSQSDLEQKLKALKEYLRLTLDEKHECPDCPDCPELTTTQSPDHIQELSRLNSLIGSLQHENSRLSSLITPPSRHKLLKRTIIALFLFFFVIVIPLFVSHQDKLIHLHNQPHHYNQITTTPAWAEYTLINVETMRNVSDNQSLVPGTIFDPPIGRMSDLKRANTTLYGNKQLIYSAYNAGKSCYVFVSGEPNSDGLDCMFGVLGTLLMSYEGLRGY